MGAQALGEDRTLPRIEGPDPRHKTSVVEGAYRTGTPVVPTHFDVSDEGRGMVLFEGNLDDPVVTIGPAE